MALSYDTSGAARVNAVGAASDVTLAAAEANEIAIIFTWLGTEEPTVTVDGNAATQIGTGITFATSQKFRAWYYLNPPTSSVIYRGIEAVNKTEIHVLLYKGAKQSGQPDSIATLDDLNPNPFTISTTVVAADSWLVSICRDYVSGAQTAGTGTTLRQAGIGASTGDSNTGYAAGSQSMGWVPDTANEDTAGIIVSIAPSVAAPVASFTPTLLTLSVG